MLPSQTGRFGTSPDMLWLLIGTAILVVLLLSLKAFASASVASIHALIRWIAAFGGIAVTALLLLSGRGPQALAGLVMVGPLLWRRWHNGGSGFSGFTGAAGTPPPRRQGSSM